MVRNLNNSGNVPTNQANQQAGLQQQLEQQQADHERAQRELQEENDRLRNEIDELKQAKERAEREAAMKKSSVRLPVPTLDSQNQSVRKWIEKFEKEAGKVGFSEEDMLSHIALYADADTANYILENEASGYQKVKELMIAELEVKNNKQLEITMTKPFEWSQAVENYVSDKMGAGRKLKWPRERIMSAVCNGLPAKFRWVEREDQLETLYEAIKSEKELYRELQRARAKGKEEPSYERPGQSTREWGKRSNAYPSYQPNKNFKLKIDRLEVD